MKYQSHSRRSKVRIGAIIVCYDLIEYHMKDKEGYEEKNVFYITFTYLFNKV